MAVTVGGFEVEFVGVGGGVRVGVGFDVVVVVARGDDLFSFRRAQ